MNELEIVEGNIDDFNGAYQKLSAEFPPEELKSFEHLKHLLFHKRYKLLLAKSKERNLTVGFALIYKLRCFPAIWLDYIVIDKKFQNAGYGSLFMRRLVHSFGTAGIFIEVEIPEEKKGRTQDQQIRRINFYERLGANSLQIPYKLPTNEGGFSMNLYFLPGSGVSQLTKEQIQETIAEVFDYIHSDVEDRGEIYQEFLPFIHDQFLK
jgi:GNAT superfamily N-acetyltransferase